MTWRKNNKVIQYLLVPWKYLYNKTRNDSMFAPFYCTYTVNVTKYWFFFLNVKCRYRKVHYFRAISKNGSLFSPLLTVYFMFSTRFITWIHPITQKCSIFIYFYIILKKKETNTQMRILFCFITENRIWFDFIYT